MSSVFFRFKSQKEPSRVTFDGTGISVFELKREIINLNRLGDGTDFELVISSEDTNEIYDDDTSIIPRSTTVIAKRLPAAKAGRGGAARYVSGKMPQNFRNSHRSEAPTSKSASQGKTADVSRSSPNVNGAQTEEERIAAMFRMGADQWAQQQQEMANATPIYRGGPPKGKAVANDDRPPPSGYICYRCGEKGHWIQSCPTNDDPTFDGRPRVKRTTGIPRSFLKTIEKPTALANDGTVDDTKQPSGVMVNAEGEWVIAEPDKASWDQYQAKAKISAAAQDAANRGSKELQDQGLECSIDKRLFVEPTKTPCCQNTYCHECITDALLENDLRCPECSSDNILIDDLIPDEKMTAKIRKYEEDKSAAAKLQREPSIRVNKEEPSSTLQRLSRPTPPSGAQKATLVPADVVAGSTSKKRPADSDFKHEQISTPLNAKLPKQPRLDDKNQPANSPQIPDRKPKALPEIPPNYQVQCSTTNFTLPQGMNSMPIPGVNGFMTMPMSMGPTLNMSSGMFDSMMMPNGSFMNGSNGSWNSMWAGGFPQQTMSMPVTGYPKGMMSSGNYAPHNPQLPMNNGFVGMNGMGTFSNQQRNTFSAPALNEEDSAYFRKPVNPHRHQARRNVNRPTDYREI